MNNLESADSLANIDFHQGAYGPSILLVLTTMESVVWLRALFESIGSAAAGTAVDLVQQPEVQATAALKSFVLCNSSDKPAIHLAREGPGTFIWACNPEEWGTLALMLEPFENLRVGHQYLTSEGIDDALVEVSYGERHARKDEPLADLG